MGLEEDSNGLFSNDDTLQSLIGGRTNVFKLFKNSGFRYYIIYFSSQAIAC
jgi:hypothetical protein